MFLQPQLLATALLCSRCFAPVSWHSASSPDVGHSAFLLRPPLFLSGRSPSSYLILDSALAFDRAALSSFLRPLSPLLRLLWESPALSLGVQTDRLSLVWSGTPPFSFGVPHSVPVSLSIGYLQTNCSFSRLPAVVVRPVRPSVVPSGPNAPNSLLGEYQPPGNSHREYPPPLT